MTTTKKKKAVKLKAGTPEVIRKLLAKFDNNISAASKALGKSAGFIGYKNKPENGGYTEADLALAQDVLDGKEIAPKAHAFDPTTHPFKLGIVILVCKTPQFERVYDIGQAMGGVWLMKMSVGKSWLGIIKIIPKDKLQTFARVASYDAEKLIAP